MSSALRLPVALVLAGLAVCPTAAQTNELDWNFRSAGAVGDGERDCTAAFRKLIQLKGLD